MLEGVPKAGSGRIAKWDNLRAALIFVVVLCHLASPIGSEKPVMTGMISFAHLFDMPAFIFVSGLFCKNAVKKKNYDRAFSFLLVYLLVKFLIFIARVLCVGSATMLMFTEKGVPWYALAMCAFLLMTMFLQRYKPIYMMVLSIVVACMAGYCSDVGTVGAFSRILVFYPHFLAGYYLDPNDILKVLDRWYAKLLALGILVGITWTGVTHISVMARFITFLRSRQSYEELDELAPYGGWLRLAFYVVSFAMIFSLIAIVPRFHIPVVSTVGKRTLSVYALHYVIVVFFLNKVVLKDLILEHYPQYWVLIYVLVTLVIVLVCASKPIDWLVSKAVNPPLRGVSEERKLR